METRVYVIDEHSEVRRSLVRRLSAAEGLVVVGDSGDPGAALEEVRALHPDVVLLEVKMKRADGIDVCGRVARLDDKMKVVVSTIYVDAEERRRAHQAGAAAYLLKDLDTPGFVKRLRALADEPATAGGNGVKGLSRIELPRPTGIEGREERPASRYRRILVPLDGSKLSEQVLPYVVALAQGLGSRIELLRVLSPASWEMADPRHGRYLHEIDASFRNRALDYLERTRDSIAGSGTGISCEASAGEPASRIISDAEKEQGTLLAMSTHGRSGITRWVLGSVTDKVFRATATPLLIVRSGERPPGNAGVRVRCIIVPLDGSVLAELSLPHAVTLAGAMQASVVLLRVAAPGEEGEARAYLGRVAGGLRGQGVAPVEEQVLEGNPAGAIVDAAHETPESLVVITTHGRSGIGRWVSGSVTDRVVRHSGGPVMVIRATG